MTAWHQPVRLREDGSFTPITAKERWDDHKVVYVRPRPPRSFLDLLYIAWGCDIFVWQVPLLKLTLALDALIVWWLS